MRIVSTTSGKHALQHVSRRSGVVKVYKRIGTYGNNSETIPDRSKTTEVVPSCTEQWTWVTLMERSSYTRGFAVRLAERFEPGVSSIHATISGRDIILIQYTPYRETASIMALTFSGLASTGTSQPEDKMKPPPSPTTSISFLQYSVTSELVPITKRLWGTSPAMQMCPFSISFA